MPISSVTTGRGEGGEEGALDAEQQRAGAPYNWGNLACSTTLGLWPVSLSSGSPLMQRGSVLPKCRGVLMASSAFLPGTGLYCSSEQGCSAPPLHAQQWGL